MAFLTQEQANKMGFKHLGKDVLISDKAVFYGTEEIEIGDRSRIDDFVIISGKVVIGKNVHITCFSLVSGGTAGIVFHDFSQVAWRCTLFANSDDYMGNTLVGATIPKKYRHMITNKPIVVESHALLGTNCIVLPGTTIGEGASVGAMSMVNKDLEGWYVYTGIPARKMCIRKKDILEKEKEYLKDLEDKGEL